MQFNSYIFIMAFLPVFVVVYYMGCRIRPALGRWLLAAGGIVFYVYGGWQTAAVLGVSILINYGMAAAISYLPGKKALLRLDIICNAGMLLYFKYYNFFISNINTCFSKDIPLKSIVLPLGISFFTFQQIMYVVNIYEERIPLNLPDYLAYILYFPRILMGPLHEPEEFIKQLHDDKLKRMDWDNLACGIKLFSFGLFKKVILADTFAAAVNWGYSNFLAVTASDWVLIMLFYTFEIYFDFSGYTDMAAGISAMLNIRLPINFDSPYKAVSIRDFWKRWHISLTGFFTRYLYIPLGGSRKGRCRTYLNTMLVFLVSGIWHGANWTFILWGILHGACSVFDRIFEKQQKKINKVIRWAAAFTAVNILWLLFRSDSIGQWGMILTKIVTLQGKAVSGGLGNTFMLPEIVFLLNTLHIDSTSVIVKALCMLGFILAGFGICLIPENNYRSFRKNNQLTLAMAVIAFIWSFLCLSSESVFVYFNF